MMDLSAYNLTALFEAILFASPDPVSIEKLISFSDCSKEAADEALAELASRYSNENSGIELIIKSDSCTLGAKLIYGEALSGFFKTRKSAFLSNAALEVLAIAAYNQPVTKTYISQIRGIPSSEIVESLLDKKLLKENGRLDLPGRPMSYSTTEKFLMIFGLESLDCLPLPEELLPVKKEESE